MEEYIGLQSATMIINESVVFQTMPVITAPMAGKPCLLILLQVKGMFHLDIRTICKFTILNMLLFFTQKFIQTHPNAK